MAVQFNTAMLVRASRGIGRLGRHVVPEIADALSAAAFSARKAEQANAKAVLDRPRPFTVSSFIATPGAAVSGYVESRINVAPRLNKTLSRLEYGGTEKKGLQIEKTGLENAFGDLGPGGIKKLLKKDVTSDKAQKLAARAAKSPKGAAAVARLKAKPATQRIGGKGQAVAGKFDNPNDRYFIAKIKNTTGVWFRAAGKRRGKAGRRGPHNLELLVSFNNDPHWQAQLGFHKTASDTGQRYAARIKDAFERAAAKARL